jgi:hypothetical protein
MVESVVGSVFTIASATFWCCLLTFPLYVAFVFGAFTSSSPIGCTSCSSCFCACFWIGWCLTYSNYF